MPVRTFESLKPEYAHLWASCQIKPAHKAEIQSVARSIIANRPTYEKIAQRTGVPWFFTGVVHAMECTQFPKFTQHLHNGDRLDRKTRLVPADRPVGVWPPEDKTADLFVESAVDALTMPGKQFDKIKDWSIERMAYCLETYNGWGYRPVKINSPYLWSYTNQYSSGKYVRDHAWSPTAVSEQCGAMALLKVLYEIDPSLTSTQAVAPAEPVERAWPKAEEKKMALTSVAAGSRTVWALVAAAGAKTLEWLEKAFDLLPDAAIDAQGMMAPIKTLTGMLKINIAGVTGTIAIVCIAMAIYRHVRDKRDLKTLKGDN